MRREPYSIAKEALDFLRRFKRKTKKPNQSNYQTNVKLELSPPSDLGFWGGGGESNSYVYIYLILTTKIEYCYI